MDSIIISEDNNIYRLFNFCVSTMCLLSSYYYGAHICFRYAPDVDPFDGSHVPLNVAIESVFLLREIDYRKLVDFVGVQYCAVCCILDVVVKILLKLR